MSIKINVNVCVVNNRTVCVSGDGSLLASGCSELVKVWRRGVCLHTFVSGYAVSSCFIPGDKYLLVGTKVRVIEHIVAMSIQCFSLLQTGAINLFEISSGLCLDTFEAHSKAVWSMCVAPDRRGFVSGSADHDVKFWEFELTTDENHEGKRLVIIDIIIISMLSTIVMFLQKKTDGFSC